MTCIARSFGGDLPLLYGCKDLSDEFKQEMLYDDPVRFYRFSEGDIAAVKKAKGTSLSDPVVSAGISQPV